jgi:hypothetical protein
MSEKRKPRTTAAAKARQGIRAKTKTATGKSVRKAPEKVRKATNAASKTASRIARREAKGKEVSDGMKARLEKRIARLEKRLDTVTKASDEKKTESAGKFESAKEKMAKLRAMRKGAKKE